MVSSANSSESHPTHCPGCTSLLFLTVAFSPAVFHICEANGEKVRNSKKVESIKQVGTAPGLALHPASLCCSIC